MACVRRLRCCVAIRLGHLLTSNSRRGSRLEEARPYALARGNGAVICDGISNTGSWAAGFKGTTNAFARHPDDIQHHI